MGIWVLFALNLPTNVQIRPYRLVASYHLRGVWTRSCPSPWRIHLNVGIASNAWLVRDVRLSVIFSVTRQILSVPFLKYLCSFWPRICTTLTAFEQKKNKIQKYKIPNPWITTDSRAMSTFPINIQSVLFTHLMFHFWF